jgi:hypothetical protein
MPKSQHNRSNFTFLYLFRVFLLLLFNFMLIMLWYSPPGIDFISALFGKIIWQGKTFIMVTSTTIALSHLFNLFYLRVRRPAFIIVQVITGLIIIGIPFSMAIMLAIAMGI